MLKLAEPLQGRAARGTPRRPELYQHDASGELLAGEGMCGEGGELEVGQSGDFVDGSAGGGVFLSHYIFLAGEDQVDHADQVGLEFRLVIGVAPWGVATGAFDLSEVSEIARDSD